MFEHKCRCRRCGSEAIYMSRKKRLTQKEQKDLEFTCNDCMVEPWEVWKKSAFVEQLPLF